MQTLVHVYCSRGQSLREVIAKDKRLIPTGFQVVKSQTPGRSPGWAKLKSVLPGRQGSLNLEWDRDARMLQCRVINRGAGRPHLVIGDFLDYLLAHHARRVRSIVIVPG